MLFLLFWIICGVFAVYFGSQKNAGGAGMFTGFLLGPIGLLSAFMFSGFKCPDCKEYVVKDAVKCKHCGSDIKGRVIKG